MEGVKNKKKMCKKNICNICDWQRITISSIHMLFHLGKKYTGYTITETPSNAQTTE